MATVQKSLARFVKDESAATAIEYALIVAGVSIVIVAVVDSVGMTLIRTLMSISSSLHQDGIVIVGGP